jgi:hypothetical protein
VGPGPVLIGTIVVAGKATYAQFAAIAPAVELRTGYLAVDPQSHQLIGLYHDAPSAMHVDFIEVVKLWVGTVVVTEAVDVSIELDLVLVTVAETSALIASIMIPAPGTT